MNIQCTTDYSIFKILKGNRDVNVTEDSKAQIRHLVKSMKKYGFIAAYPLVVNIDMMVEDGQHRLKSAEIAGCPVYYVVSDGLAMEAVREAGGLSRKWTIIDYISSYVSAGVEDYKKLAVISSASEFNEGVVVWIWIRAYDANCMKFRDDVRAGTFKMTNELEVKFATLHQHLRELNASAPNFIKTCSSASGALTLLTHPEYDHAKMKDKLAYLSTRLVRCASTEEYANLLFDIYNYKTLPATRIKPLGNFTLRLRKI